MAELLLRRGKLASLANVTVKDGTIYLTTDEPGLYVDVDMSTAKDGSNVVRKRIGDFQSYATLDALEDAVKHDTLSATALYYVEDVNYLLRWDAKNKQFKWINDTSALAQSIASLDETLSAQASKISANTTAIATEKSRAEAAEASLQSQIDDLTGGSGESLAKLRQDLTDEIARSTKADSTHTEDISALATRVSANETSITTINTEITNLKAADTALGARIDDVIGEGDSKDDLSLTGLKKLIEANKSAAAEEDAALSNAIAAETSRAKAAEEALAARATTLESFKTSATSDISTLKTNVAALQVKDENLDADIAELEAALNAEVKRAQAAEAENAQAVADEATARANADTALGQRIDTTNTNVTNLTTRVTAVETKASENAAAITTNATNLTNEIARAKAAESTLDTKIDTTKSTLLGSSTGTSTDGATIYDLIRKTNNLQTGLNSATSANTELASVVSSLSKTVTDNESDIENKLAALKTTVNANETDIEKKVSDLTAVVNANETDIETKLEEHTSAANTKFNSVATLIDADANLTKILTDDFNADIVKQLDANASNTLSDYVNAVFQAAKTYSDNQLDAASAMIYKGAVAGDKVASTVLSLAYAEAGWTYVVTSDSTGGQDAVYHAGDLIVCNVDIEGTASTSSWVVVETGYQPDHVPTLKVVDATPASNAAYQAASINVQIAGENAANNSPVYIRTDHINTNLRISNDGQYINIGMEWDEF